MLTTRSRSVDRRAGPAAGGRSTDAVAGYLEALEASVVHRARTWSGADGAPRPEQPVAAEPADAPELRRLEHGFVAYARVYAAAHGIEYATWREFGVPAEVLGRAGIRPDR
jgi:hypothetical protein